MERKREIAIDYLRAIAIVVMILTHSLVYYFNVKSVYFFWDLLHFAVPIFVFCASYVFFIKINNTGVFNNFAYIEKRLWRIIIPYYLFFIAYLIINLLTGRSLSQRFVFQSIVLTGGIDINWLVLLFTFFAFLFPLLKYLIKNHYKLFILYSLFSILSTFYLLVSKPLPYFRYYMFIPWSTIAIYGYFFQKYKDSKKFIVLNVFGGLLLFVFSYWAKSINHTSLFLFNNKYPPNLYYLSYGFVFLNVLYLLFNQLTINNETVNDFLKYISSNSYSLFFIHYLVIYLLVFFSVPKIIPWPFFFVIVLILSLIVQKIFILISSDQSKSK